jgi:hypothetical protein
MSSLSLPDQPGYGQPAADALEAYPKASESGAEKTVSMFDEQLDPAAFIRTYRTRPVREISYTEQGVEEAFRQLGKQTAEQRTHNCYACGSETCRDMAVRIAKGYQRSG